MHYILLGKFLNNARVKKVETGSGNSALVFAASEEKKTRATIYTTEKGKKKALKRIIKGESV